MWSFSVVKLVKIHLKNNVLFLSVIAFWKTQSHKLAILYSNEIFITLSESLEMRIVELNKAVFSVLYLTKQKGRISCGAHSYQSALTISLKVCIKIQKPICIHALSSILLPLPFLSFFNFFLTESHLAQHGLQPETLDPLTLIPYILGL